MGGKRQKIADNYLSLKAYAVSAADKVDDYVAKGKGRALSAIGDLLATVGAQGAVHAPSEEGVGMGGSELPEIFSGKSIKVSTRSTRSRASPATSCTSTVAPLVCPTRCPTSPCSLPACPPTSLSLLR